MLLNIDLIILEIAFKFYTPSWTSWLGQTDMPTLPTVEQLCGLTKDHTPYLRVICFSTYSDKASSATAPSLSLFSLKLSPTFLSKFPLTKQLQCYWFSLCFMAVKLHHQSFVSSWYSHFLIIFNPNFRL